ncbi:UNVERIFIED_CONTAM: hypothetical protein K2H54_025143, partial [Gekko kuhli]
MTVGDAPLSVPWGVPIEPSAFFGEWDCQYHKLPSLLHFTTSYPISMKFTCGSMSLRSWAHIKNPFSLTDDFSPLNIPLVFSFTTWGGGKDFLASGLGSLLTKLFFFPSALC